MSWYPWSVAVMAIVHLWHKVSTSCHAIHRSVHVVVSLDVMESGQDHEVRYLSTYLLDRGQDQVLGSCGEHPYTHTVYMQRMPIQHHW